MWSLSSDTAVMKINAACAFFAKLLYMLSSCSDFSCYACIYGVARMKKNISVTRVPLLPAYQTVSVLRNIPVYHVLPPSHNIRSFLTLRTEGVLVFVSFKKSEALVVPQSQRKLAYCSTSSD